MTAIAAILAALASGLTAIFAHGDMGLTVAVVCLILSLFLNYILINKILKMFDVFSQVRDTVNALNERIGHDK